MGGHYSTRVREVIPTFFDLRTGKTAKSTFDNSEYWWTEGNGSCDCNRMRAFGDALLEQLECEQHKAKPELLPWQSVCFGCKRFIAIDIEGDLEGFTKEQLLVAMNSEYGE